ncbi:polyketide cyclase/dehydrase/lipid transport protein [Umezawaea tangerina]|uniref:Polyketide cyclase/dehydrase/lipid transport protein n=1 Tax=Umezawaea tangerina TaxID=84725 RepID=A0A2T0T9A1_9PSEU|nr:polyketide cyclase/dehydrase/lipid transport protein [Umezawaea tangerina]
MPPNLYRFHSTWPVACSTAVAFEVLSDLGSYPLWWPEVKQAVKVDDRCARLHCRSLLPYELVFQARHNTQDPDRGLLVADLTGDLDGTVGWRIEADGERTRLVYEQVVTVRKPLLRKLGVVARPALVANHELMMRHGQRGLYTYLAGFHAGRHQHPEPPHPEHGQTRQTPQAPQ